MNRESKIVENIVAGYSYATEQLVLELEGWQPFNVDVIRELGRVYFNFLDDDGNKRDDGRFQLIDYKQEPRHLTYQQEQEMKRRKVAPMTIVHGTIPMGSAKMAYLSIAKMLDQKFGYETRTSWR